MHVQALLVYTELRLQYKMQDNLLLILKTLIYNLESFLVVSKCNQILKCLDLGLITQKLCIHATLAY